MQGARAISAAPPDRRARGAEIRPPLSELLGLTLRGQTPRRQRICNDRAAAQMPPSLDFALIQRLRDVLDDRPAIESELRTLKEQAEAWARTISGQLESSERRIRRLNQNPASSLSQIASELRRVE